MEAKYNEFLVNMNIPRVASYFEQKLILEYPNTRIEIGPPGVVNEATPVMVYNIFVDVYVANEKTTKDFNVLVTIEDIEKFNITMLDSDIENVKRELKAVTTPNIIL